jgi:hypothetical protein
MRFGRSIAVTVLAAGLISGGLVRAAGTEPAKPPGPPTSDAALNTGPKFATKVGEVAWKQTALKPEHGVLQQLSGKFKTKVHLYSGPYVRMLDTEGVAEGKILMGGPFVDVTHSEKRMKEPFDARITFGYDEAIGKYVADAIDSASTAIIHYVGTFDAGKKQLVLTAHYSDQQSRTLRISKIVTTLVDANTWTYDEYESYKVGGPEAHIVTISFTRQ